MSTNSVNFTGCAWRESNPLPCGPEFRDVSFSYTGWYSLGAVKCRSSSRLLVPTVVRNVVSAPSRSPADADVKVLRPARSEAEPVSVVAGDLSRSPAETRRRRGLRKAKLIGERAAGNEMWIASGFPKSVNGGHACVGTVEERDPFVETT